MVPSWCTTLRHGSTDLNNSVGSCQRSRSIILSCLLSSERSMLRGRCSMWQSSSSWPSSHLAFLVSPAPRMMAARVIRLRYASIFSADSLQLVGSRHSCRKTVQCCGETAPPLNTIKTLSLGKCPLRTCISSNKRVWWAICSKDSIPSKGVKTKFFKSSKPLLLYQAIKLMPTPLSPRARTSLSSPNVGWSRMT